MHNSRKITDKIVANNFIFVFYFKGGILLLSFVKKIKKSHDLNNYKFVYKKYTFARKFILLKNEKYFPKNIIFFFMIFFLHTG